MEDSWKDTWGKVSWYKTEDEVEQQVKELLANGANVNDKNSDGETPLMEACSRGYIKIIELLLQKGAEINAEDNHHNSPLLYAATANMDTVEFLKAHGANEKTSTGKTMLMSAAAHHAPTMVTELIKQAYNVNEADEDNTTALMLAVLNQRDFATEELVKAGADVNAINNNGRTALSFAIKKLDYGYIQYLIDNKADVNIKDKRNRVAALTAFVESNAFIKEDYAKVMDKLVAAGIDVNAQDDYGETALMMAALHGKDDVMKELFRAGAKVYPESDFWKRFTGRRRNQKPGSFNFQEIIVPIIESGNADALQELMDAGIDLKPNGGVYVTNFVKAVSSGHKEVVRKLIDAGADVNKKDEEFFMTPLMVAARKGHAGVIQVLCENGAQINTQTNDDGQTALMMAVENEQVQAVQRLIDLGADMTIKDKEGKTVLDYAKTAEMKKFIEFAMQKKAEETGKKEKVTSSFSRFFKKGPRD